MRALIYCVVSCLLFGRFNYVGAVYFTMSNLQINLPGNRSAYPPVNYSLVTLLALPSDKEDTSKHFTYALEKRQQNYLQIYRSTGDIMFTKHYFNGRAKDIENISVIATVEDSSGMKDNTTFQVNVASTAESDCYLMERNLCYWQSANYRIFENRNASVIGTLNSPYWARLCPDFKMHYKLSKANGMLELVPPTNKNDSWYLRTRIPIDRDIMHTVKIFKVDRTDLIQATVICYLEDTNGTKMELRKDIEVDVMDENDNAPISQHNGDVYVYLNSNVVQMGQVVELRHYGKENKLLIIDHDSPAVNNHEIRILNDTRKLLQESCSNFSNTLSDDPDVKVHSIISCKLTFLKDTKIRLPYTVILQVNDTAFLPKYGKSWIRIPIHFELHSPHANALTTAPNEFPKELILYPEREVKIFRTAAPYARITQPQARKLKGCKNFVLLNSSNYNAMSDMFGVTTEGIIYTFDISLLRVSSSPVKLKVQWEKEEGGMANYQMDELNINILVEPSHTCTKNVKNWAHCANITNPKRCAAADACALGTGGSASVKKRAHKDEKRCMWRGESKDSHNSSSSHLYSTCTPDIETCPDGICDSLEDLHKLICPQDCSDNIVFPTNKNRNGRGIHSAEGTCTCDEIGQCGCEKRPKMRKVFNNYSNGTTLRNVTETTTSSAAPNISSYVGDSGPEIASCGTSCLLGILAGGLFLLGAITGVVICWRLGRVHKVRGKFSEDNNDLSAPLSDYVDRGLVPENTITLNFDMTTTLNQERDKTAPDPKWEFPRSRLIIEQTLGEGEFGRVLRARAKDIADNPGYTVVAVKTLKDDAREAELSDLLSEYHLLKEVSHPNIIRLLGASTLPGGPVYLIIEFAHYGSLRSYLRRSRHLKSESEPPFSARLEDNLQRNDNYDEPKLCKITPTDVLSFAWQISKGMSYLSDVKLVHRDLAARNVLLDENKVCKISDFGLTRDIYEDDAYFKRSKGRVPVKWMAPESLSDHIYTSKSDVWSFGILVWELVTLGATPYPGIQVQNLFHLLKTGYRMERPENCSPALFKIMKSCWHIDPERRPTFHSLSTKWETMLSDQVEYLDLTPNAIHNRSYFCPLGENGEEENKNTSSTINEVDEEDDDEDEENLQKNLAKNQDYPKCGDTDKLLEDSKMHNISMNQLSPLIGNNNTQGYETPVKIRYKTDRPSTPTNENPHYYTNMDASRNGQ